MKGKSERSRVLILAGHTDDAEVGMAGTIMNFVRDGTSVIIANMTSHPLSRKAALKAAGILGVKKYEWLGFKPTEVTDSRDTLGLVRRVVEKHKPDIIFTHWPVDEHSDHRATATLSIRCVNEYYQRYVDDKGSYHYDVRTPQLYFYEALTGKQTKCFIPDTYVDISPVAEKKKEVMRCFRSGSNDTYFDQWYEHHLLMMAFRGREAGTIRHSEIDRGVFAEAFVSYPIPRGRTRIPIPGAL